MTHRERVKSAIRFENPKPVPYSIDFTHQMLDKMIAYTKDDNFYNTLDNAIAISVLIKPEEEVRPEYFRDEFGVVWNKSGVDKDIGVVDTYLIAGIENLDTYTFPPVDEAFVRGQMETLMRTRGDKFTIAAIGFSLFERAWTLHGMENLLCDMVGDPIFVHAIMERITERNLRIINIALEYDIDCIHFGDDWGQQRGMLMGPIHWREFIKPYLLLMYDKVHQAGKFVSQHSCGDIRLVMEDLFEIGLNIYQTYQPEIYGLDYARKLEGKVTVWGGISTQMELPVKTPAEIEHITAELLRSFPSGGLIAAPTHSVPSDVPPENILAMLRVLNHQYAY